VTFQAGRWPWRGQRTPIESRHRWKSYSAVVVRICRALNEAGVRYVLIGGLAVIAHRATRFTKDIDLLVDDDADNVGRGRTTLAVLADNAVDDVRDTHVRKHVVVHVADEVIVDLSPATLLRTKDTDRPQDPLDRGFLEELTRR
jgi:hypothetical protein